MKLTGTQTAALSAAAARGNGTILPLPAHIRGGAIGKVCDALVAKGFATIAGALKKKLGLKVGSEAIEGRGRVYRIQR